MRYQFIILPILSVFLISCNQNKFQEKVTQKVNPDNVKLNDVFFEPEAAGRDTIPDGKKYDFRLDSLMSFLHKYEAGTTDFSIKNYREYWENTLERIITVDIGVETAKKWFRATGLLFELTGEAKHSEELERVIYTSFKRNLTENEIESFAKPYVFTKHVDHVHVNLFVPSEISYSHSMGGGVKIRQETGYPESGRVLVKFSMTDKQYIELFVRIPSWAEDASVEVKGVKYIAPPGSYCKIAKKWK
ncbi:MAG: hypothetical protein ACOCWK_03695, partial [Tangfeifania sp.]